MKRDILLYIIKKRCPVGTGGTGIFGTPVLLLKQAVSFVPEGPEMQTVNDQMINSGQSCHNDALPATGKGKS